MKRIFLALTLAGLIVAPAQAGFKLMPTGKAQLVGKLGLSVTPPNDWNRLGSKIGRNAESWTLDGLSLNDLTFYAGIEEGRTLFREVDKKNRPLPKFTAAMLPTDIVSLFEGSYRVAAATSLFEIGKVEPAIFAGKAGVHFTYSFVQPALGQLSTFSSQGPTRDGRQKPEVSAPGGCGHCCLVVRSSGQPRAALYFIGR